MRTCRRRCTWSCLLGLILPLCLAAAALGQSRLDPGFYTNTNLWTAQERQQVNNLVSARVEQMRSGEEQAINEAKAALVTELTVANANERFVSQFSEVVAEQLAPLVDAQDVQVRINAMIVCSNLRTARALDLVLNGLADENAGVRYLASKAMEGLLRGDQLSPPERTRALDQLSQIIVDEGEVFVVGPMLDALVQAGDNLRVLEVLNQRVAWHAERPAAAYGPESGTFRAIFTNLFTTTNREPAELRELARASARYTLLIAEQEVDKPGRIEADASRLELLQIAVRALEVAHGDLPVAGALPPVRNAVETRNWPNLTEAGQAWITLLKAAPFNYNDAQLAVAGE